MDRIDRMIEEMKLEGDLLPNNPKSKEYCAGCGGHLNPEYTFEHNLLKYCGHCHYYHPEKIA